MLGFIYRICLLTVFKRIDLLLTGNMGHARGAAAVRAAKKDGTNVAIGVLAIQLGMILYCEIASCFCWRSDSWTSAA